MLRTISTLLCTALLTTALSGVALAPNAQARAPMMVAQKGEMTAREAAAQARAQHGGKVLRVRKQGNVYKVRLLKKSGRVVTVTVQG